MFYYVNLKHSWCDETKSIVASGNFSVSPQGGIWLFAFSSVSFRAASNYTQFYNSNTRIFVVQRCLVSLVTTLANYKNCKCSTRSNASAHFVHSSYKRVYTCHYCKLDNCCQIIVEKKYHEKCRTPFLKLVVENFLYLRYNNGFRLLRLFILLSYYHSIILLYIIWR